MQPISSYLLNINATSEEISRDEDATASGAELPHDRLSLRLLHVSVQTRHRELVLRHHLRQILDLQFEHSDNFQRIEYMEYSKMMR